MAGLRLIGQSERRLAQTAHTGQHTTGLYIVLLDKFLQIQREISTRIKT